VKDEIFTKLTLKTWSTSFDNEMVKKGSLKVDAVKKSRWVEMVEVGDGACMEWHRA